MARGLDGEVVAAMTRELQGMGRPAKRSSAFRFLIWGVPLIAGLIGFVFGDLFNLSGLLSTWAGPSLVGLPLGDSLGYSSMAAAGVYGAGVGGLVALPGPLGGGAMGSRVFRTLQV